jgi:hypothetical protein
MRRNTGETMVMVEEEKGMKEGVTGIPIIKRVIKDIGIKLPGSLPAS